MTDKPKNQPADDASAEKSTPDLKDIPALFATIHWRSPQRPDGYTAEQVEEINRKLNEDFEQRTNGDR